MQTSKNELTTLLGTDVRIQVREYENGRPALIAFEDSTGEPFVNITVNVPEAPIPEGTAFIKTWSENHGILQELIDNGIVSSPMGEVALGYVSAPLCKVLI